MSLFFLSVPCRRFLGESRYVFFYQKPMLLDNHGIQHICHTTVTHLLSPSSEYLTSVLCLAIFDMIFSINVFFFYFLFTYRFL